MQVCSLTHRAVRNNLPLPPSPHFMHASFLLTSAALIAQELAARGVTLEMVVDEGSVISMDGLPPIYSLPMALVGLAEKPYVTLEVGSTVQVAVPAAHNE